MGNKFFLVALCLSLAAGLRAEEFSAEALEFFEKEVRPLLAAQCYQCHGPEKHKGALRLDSRAAILAGGESGAAAVPNKPAESLMIKAINYVDDLNMPKKQKLKDAEIATLTKWVQIGMPWPAEKETAAVQKGAYQITPEQRQFWSFQPIKDYPAPTVKDNAWPRSDIDRFILAGLEAKDLKPAAPADKRTLIRRATFDLAGLPPTPEDVEAFVNDAAPDAFAKVIERLLASPQYGERWGRHWLDVVRYADARDNRYIGGEADIVDAWRYRDWVVNAFNRDLPYDQFILNQIAGDLLPAAQPGAINTEGLVATGLLTIGEWGTGDADKEKMMTDIVDDQIDVVSRGFMGLTMACARCHDHKFDPIPTADYYSLAGIFFSTHIIPNPGPKTNGTPMLRTPLVPQSEVDKVAQYEARLKELDQQIKAETDKQYEQFTRSLLPQTAKYLLAAWNYQQQPADKRPALAALAAQEQLHEFALKNWTELLARAAGPLTAPGIDYNLLTMPIRNPLNSTNVNGWRGAAECPVLLANTNENDMAILTFVLPPRSVAIHPGPEFGVAVGWKSPIAGRVHIAGKVTDADNKGGDGITWVIDHRSAKGSKELAFGVIPDGGSQKFADGTGARQLLEVDVSAGDFLQLLVLPKDNYYCDTTVVELTITAADGKVWNLAQDVVPDLHEGNPHSDRQGHAGVWYFYDMAGHKRVPGATGDVLQLAADFTAASRNVTSEVVQKNAEDLQKVVLAATAESPLYKEFSGKQSPFWVNVRDDAKFLTGKAGEAITALRNDLETQKKNPPPPVPMALAALEGGVPHSGYQGINDSKIHVRGSYMRLGESVPRRFPRILAGEQQTPITEGSGRLQLAKWLVSPEHPLTARVMANRIWQWHFGAGIVRTASNFGKLGEKPTHPELLDYLAKQFVKSGWSVKALHRAIMLSAAYQQSSQGQPETVKTDGDNRLFGHMNRRRLEAEALRDSLLAASGRLDKKMGGPSERDPLLPRRMLYLMSVRSDRSSFGPLFDAADAAAQVDRRTVSTVAPQALFMLNHAFVLEQTAAMAKGLLAAPDDSARINKAYLALFGRPPSADELRIGLEFLKRVQGGGAQGERAWQEYCQVLLCANEFVFVD